jgi:EAL domain-containing protein (putative c-di-GMP-specific phosphodiesterase class I)
VPLAGVTYAWDMASDLLAWGPGASEALGLSPKDLPRTGQAFNRMIEPRSGLARHEIVAASGAPRAFDTRYALRLAPDRVLMVLDAGRWQPDAGGRPAVVRGQLRVDAASSTQDVLPASIQARSDLLCSIQGDINEALQLSHTCTLIVGSFEDDEVEGAEGIAPRLRPMMRRHDRFAALSPNRFALTLTGCPASEAVGAMRRLRELLAFHPAHASLCLGAACAPDHTFQATKLLRFAESALEVSIERGGTAMLHDSRRAPAPSPSERTPYDLVAALNGRSLTLACRPVVDAQTRAPALMQACAVMTQTDGGTAPLGPLPHLEEDNLALLVDGRMLELAADYLVQHPHERLALPVNLETLQDAEWLPMLAAHLGARPGIESRLMIEVPESALARNRAMRGRLDAMKALGIGLSLTGFGAGYVSPVQLQDLPVDLLKIDGVFIQPLKRSTDDRLFVRTLIDRAHHLGVATMAEWVDDEDMARMLASWGVDYLEGSLFGEFRPAVQPRTLREMAKAIRA